MKLKPSKILIDLSLVLLILLTSSKVGPPGLDIPENLEYHEKSESMTINQGLNFCYNQTMMSNLLKHRNQEETGVHQYSPLVKADCSRTLRFCLCLMYALAQTISEELSSPRSICERALDGCERIMTNYGLKWVPSLDCYKRPEYGKDPALLCVVKEGTPQRISTTRQSLFMSSPQFQFGWHPEPYGDVLRVKDHGFVDSLQFSVPKRLGYSLEIGGKVTNWGASCGTDQFRCPETTTIWTVLCSSSCSLVVLTFFVATDTFRFPEKLMILPVLCAFLCFLASLTFSIGTDVFRFPEKLMIWAVLCFFLCSLVVPTFFIATDTFRCPEKLMISLSVCYLLVALVYVVGWVSGESISYKATSSHSQGFQEQIVSTITQEPSHAMGTLLLMFLYLFGMASSIWWVIWSLTWFFAAVLECNKGEGGTDVCHTNRRKVGVFLLAAFVFFMFFVGSSASSDGRIDCPGISPQHLIFRQEKSQWKVSDVSGEGVWLRLQDRNIKLTPSLMYAVHEGTILHLGGENGIKVTFKLGSDDAATPPKRTKEQENLESASILKTLQAKHQEELKAAQEEGARKSAECTRLRQELAQIRKQKEEVQRNLNASKAQVTRLNAANETLKADHAADMRRVEREKKTVVEHLVIEQRQKKMWLRQYQGSLKTVKERLSTSEEAHSALKKKLVAYQTLLQVEGTNMEIDDQDDLEDPLEHYLKCSICLHTAQVPVSLNCLHTFCEDCIGRWRATSNKCPLCNQTITVSYRSDVNASLTAPASQ